MSVSEKIMMREGGEGVKSMQSGCPSKFSLRVDARTVQVFETDMFEYIDEDDV